MSPYIISEPESGDEIAIGPMHLQSWHETYTNKELGVDTAFINNNHGKVATEAGSEFRRKRIAEAKANPDKVMYKVVKDSQGEVVGFFIAEKDKKYNELQAIYLLDIAKGSGVADDLMRMFFDWIDPKLPCRLEAAAYNRRALKFYERYGFKTTHKKMPLHYGKMPTVEMVRKVDQ